MPYFIVGTNEERVAMKATADEVHGALEKAREMLEGGMNLVTIVDTRGRKIVHPNAKNSDSMPDRSKSSSMSGVFGRVRL
jgi:hypothetical protein